MKKIAVILILFCSVFPPIYADTFVFNRTDRVTLTPPAGWDIWSMENFDRRGNHSITFIADKSRKPGATLTILAGSRHPVYTETSFLEYAERMYAQSAGQFIEKKPAFRRLDIDNGFAYYTVAQYEAYAGLPPAEGRAKVCGIVLIYKENSPVVFADLYVDDPSDPALDIMVKALLGIEMYFPDYMSNIFRFNQRHAVKLNIPDTWQVRMSGAETEGGVGYTLSIDTDNDVRFLGLITILVAAQPAQMTRERFFALIREESDSYLSQSVEDQAVIVPINVSNGYGAYYVLTDADLVGKTPGPDEYKIFARVVIQYNNGALATITALMDDSECDEFAQFMESLLTMEPVF